ncbi:MAG: hypothetical protein F4Y86_10265 [Gammaproteobacteria bacterium]|nr:hypothetical protein [Gammaproteobacteria bacterium]
MGDDPICGKAEGLLPRCNVVAGAGDVGDLGIERASIGAEQPGSGIGVVCGPGVVHCGGNVEQVARVHGGAGVVAADGVQKHFIPASRGGSSAARDCAGEEVCGHGHVVTGHLVTGASSVTVAESAAGIGGPVAEGVVLRRRIGNDGNHLSFDVLAVASALHDAQPIGRGRWRRFVYRWRG